MNRRLDLIPEAKVQGGHHRIHRVAAFQVEIQLRIGTNEGLNTRSKATPFPSTPSHPHTTQLLPSPLTFLAEVRTQFTMLPQAITLQGPPGWEATQIPVWQPVWTL
jgi:hypothetical protein